MEFSFHRAFTLSYQDIGPRTYEARVSGRFDKSGFRGRIHFAKDNALDKKSSKLILKKSSETPSAKGLYERVETLRRVEKCLDPSFKRQQPVSGESKDKGEGHKIDQ